MSNEKTAEVVIETKSVFELVAAEKQRLINVENKRIEAERIAKAANVEHMREINRQALCDFIKHGMTEDLARKVVVFIASNKISNITINY